MSREARERFLSFACSPDAAWTANFRDFNGAVLRMSALAPGGRITTEIVADEIRRLQAGWRAAGDDGADDLLDRTVPADTLAGLDRFDRVQLVEVVRVCRRSRSLSEAGRTLFGVSRRKRSAPNDADRLRKYLARFGLDWKGLAGADRRPEG